MRGSVRRAPHTPPDEAECESRGRACGAPSVLRVRYAGASCDDVTRVSDETEIAISLAKLR